MVDPPLTGFPHHYCNTSWLPPASPAAAVVCSSRIALISRSNTKLVAGRLKKLEQKRRHKKVITASSFEERTENVQVVGFWPLRTVLGFWQLFCFLKTVSNWNQCLGFKKDICWPIAETLALSMLKLAYENWPQFSYCFCRPLIQEKNVYKKGDFESSRVTNIKVQTKKM